MKFRQILLACALMGSCLYASADTVINFDDLNTSANVEAVQNGYAGMIWVNFAAANGASAFPQTGYEHGTVSGLSAGFNPNGDDASMNLIDAMYGSVFELKSMYITKAAGSGVTLVWGIVNRQIAYLQAVYATDAQATFVSFSGWQNLNGVVFQNHDGSGATVFDDITINITSLNPTSPVPEPATYAMLLAGLVLVGARRRYKVK